jgi:Lamin Tail Domain
VHKYRNPKVLCIEGCILSASQFYLKRGWRCGRCPRGSDLKPPSTKAPVKAPVTKAPVTKPTKRPTKAPTKRPTKNPTQLPSASPSREIRILITEVMFKPDSKGDFDTEWFELYNGRTGDINLIGWKVTDNLDSWIIATNLVIRPNQYIVLASSRNAKANRGFTPNYVLQDLALNNVKDSIVLTKPNGMVEDTFSWDSPTDAFVEGVSFGRQSPTLTNPCFGTGTPYVGTNKGTPGAANVCAP